MMDPVVNDDIPPINDDEIDLLKFLLAIWRGKYLIVVLCLCAVCASYLYSKRLPKYYRSETLLITSGSDAGGLGAALSSLPLSGMLGGASGIQSPSDKIMVVLKSRGAAEAVINRFDLMKIFYAKQWDAAKGAWKDPENIPVMEDAVKMLGTTVMSMSKNKDGAITIAAEWTDAQLAADIANYYVSVLTGMLNEKAITVTVQIVDKAIPSVRKSKPNVTLNMIIAGALSFVVGAALVIIFDVVRTHKKRS